LLHFVPLFGPPGAAPRRKGSLGKTLQHHEIGHDPGAPAILRSRLISLFRLQNAVIGGQAAIFSLLNYGGGGFFD
jgi:hypothetical protein